MGGIDGFRLLLASRCRCGRSVGNCFLVLVGVGVVPVLYFLRWYNGTAQSVCVKHGVRRSPNWCLCWLIILHDLGGMNVTPYPHCGTIMHRNRTTRAGTAQYRCPPSQPLLSSRSSPLPLSPRPNVISSESTFLVTPPVPASLVISSERSESRDLTLASINSEDPSTRYARSG